jgi:hypothetical protein
MREKYYYYKIDHLMCLLTNVSFIPSALAFHSVLSLNSNYNQNLIREADGRLDAFAHHHHHRHSRSSFAYI